MSKYDKISEDPQIQADYEEIRERGECHNLARILALRKPPGAKTDREFLEGHCNGSQFEGQEWVGEHYARVARRHGVDPKGKVYLSGLARFPGDPQAWVEGRGDIERVLDRNGWGAEGIVSRKVADPGEPMNVGLDPAIVENKVEEILDGVEDAHLVDREDLREQVTERMKPHWVKEVASGGTTGE